MLIVILMILGYIVIGGIVAGILDYLGMEPLWFDALFDALFWPVTVPVLIVLFIVKYIAGLTRDFIDYIRYEFKRRKEIWKQFT